jgi:hypothetical protein
MLVDKNISKNIKFLENKNQSVKNPYGKNVSSKIADIVEKIYG